MSEIFNLKSGRGLEIQILNYIKEINTPFVNLKYFLVVWCMRVCALVGSSLYVQLLYQYFENYYF